jgi:hypothetical protein
MSTEESRVKRLELVLNGVEDERERERAHAVRTLQSLLPLQPLEVLLIVKRIDAALRAERPPHWKYTTGALTVAAALLSAERGEALEQLTTTARVSRRNVAPGVAERHCFQETPQRMALVQSVDHETLEALLELLTATLPMFLGRSEAALRVAAVEALRQVVSHRSLAAWTYLVPTLLCLLEEQLVRSRSSESITLTQDKAKATISETFAVSDKPVTTAQETFALESTLDAIAAGLSALAPLDLVPSLVLAHHAFLESNVLSRCLQHRNRFVRESLLHLVCELIRRCQDLLDRCEGQVQDNRQLVRATALACAPLIARGLDDNWSQVRFAGMLAAHRLYLVFEQLPLQLRFSVDRLLLPRLCLNRHYLAEGVREYARKTWLALFGAHGRELVATNLADVIPYVLKESQAENHAVREAACHLMAEIADRLDPCLVKPYVDALLTALIDCFHDESWPVRDCASSACAALAMVFDLHEQPPERVDELFTLWFRHCADNIPSVRQHAAEALAKVSARLQGAYLERVFEYLGSALARATEQPPDLIAGESASTEVTETTFQSMKQVRDNDVRLHSNQTMYSCGSLAPKMRARHQRVGCMDCAYLREPEPWEYTDGALYVWRHLSELGYGERCASSPYLELIVERLIQLPMFHRLPTLWATLWTQFALALPFLPPQRIAEMLPRIRAAMGRVADCGQAHVLRALEEMRQALKPWETTDDSK